MTIDLSEHGIHPAQPKDPAVVLVLHEDPYAVKLWRRVVAAFAEVTMVESIEEAPKRISLAVMPEGPKEPQPTPGLAVIESGRPTRRRDLGLQGLDRPSAFEAAEVLRVRLDHIHGRSHAHDVPRLDERPSVLLVDDEPMVLGLMARNLSVLRPYLRMRTTGSAQEAIDILSEERFDIVFVDSFMPPPGGLGLLDWMRAQPDYGVTDIMIKRGTNCIRFDLSPYAPFAIVPELCSLEDLRNQFGAALIRRGYEPIVVPSLWMRNRQRSALRHKQATCDAIEPRQRRPNVLVVDDDDHATRLVARRLRAYCPQVFVERVHGGEEALEHFSQRTVDLVILDDFMPVLDGFDVIRAMRSTPNMRNTPVIFYTANGTHGANPVADCHPLAYLTPFGNVALTHVVACALTERGFDLPPPEGGWPAFEEPSDHEYLDPDFRARLIATAGPR